MGEALAGLGAGGGAAGAAAPLRQSISQGGLPAMTPEYGMTMNDPVLTGAQKATPQPGFWTDLQGGWNRLTPMQKMQISMQGLNAGMGIAGRGGQQQAPMPSMSPMGGVPLPQVQRTSTQLTPVRRFDAMRRYGQFGIS